MGMNETKIPGINSSKRPRPFSSSSVPTGSNLAELPVNKKRHSVLANITNMAVSNGPYPIKRDPFPSTSPYQTKIQSTNMRLLNKYFYGDPTVIEEVKKRERKVLKDIHISTRQIQDAESELKSLNDDIIPQLKYDLNKKSIVFKHLKQDLMSTDDRLVRLTSDCDLQKRNYELIIKNMELKHSVQLQESINSWQQKVAIQKQGWELELQELKQTEPDPALLKEIRDLEVEKTNRERVLADLQQSNQEMSILHEAELKSELEKFKEEKKSPLADSITQNRTLREELSRLQTAKQDIETKIKTTQETRSKLIEKIGRRHEELLAVEQSLLPVEQKLSELQIRYASEKEITAKVKAQAKLAETDYNKQYDRMEQEQRQRRILENTIDELDGHVRCFAYIDYNNFHDMEVDYTNKCIIGDTDVYYFNRILPADLISPTNLFRDECYTFIESCLKKDKSCNIISINEDLRKHFLHSVIEQYHESKILVQMVVLDDDDASKDLLNSEEESDLSAVIDEKCIDFHSRRLPIKDVESFISLEFKGLHVMKFEIFDKSEKCQSVFFIQAPTKEIAKLDSTPLSKVPRTPVSTFLHSVLLRIQSLVILNLNTPDASLLQLSQTLHKLPNPK